MKMSTAGGVMRRFFFWMGLVFFIVYMLFPFYWAVNSSLKTEAQLQMMPAAFLPVDPHTGDFAPTFINYLAVMRNKQFINGLINSTLVAGATTLMALCAGAFAGFALGKLRFKGKKITLYIILAMTMFPQVTVLAGLYAVITQLNLGARLSMILAYMLFTLPFSTWVLTSFFRDLPDEILKSAQVDGATPFQAFRMILLPLTAPALVTTGLLSFIAAWNEYLFALTFTSIEPEARTVPVAISLFSGTVARQEPFGEIMAAAVLVTVPIVVMVIIFQRRIVAGLTSGAVKG
jgi:trehalose/maltose transport system permease protein